MWARLRSFLTALTRREQFEDTLSAELRFHLDAYADDLIKKGQSRQEAYRLARVHFGSVERARDECRDARGLRSVDTLRQDVRVGARVLLRAPLVSAVAVLTIALAAGLAILTFSIVYGVLLRPLPFERGDRVVAIEARGEFGGGNGDFEALDLGDFRDRQRSFDQVEGYARGSAILDRPGTPPERLPAGYVTAGALDLLGVPPLLGRTFTDGEDFTSAIRHVVLGERLWRTRFDGAPEIIGRRLRIGGRLLEVVGVMPAGFRFPVNSDLWLPLSGQSSFEVLGRLRDGVSVDMADAEARALASQIWSEDIVASAPSARLVFPFADRYVSPGFSSLLIVAIIAVAGVLVVACANVSNLLLARSMARRREVVLRIILGAGQLRIVRQFIVESLLLAVPGTVTGLWLAGLGLRMFGRFQSNLALPYWVEIRLDMPALLATGLLTVVVAVAAGLFPALHASRASAGAVATTFDRGSTPRPQWASAWLVVAQVALCCTFMVAAGLVMRSALHLRGLDHGFDAAPVLSGNVGFTRADQPDPVNALMTLIERTEALAGVSSASLVRTAPGNGPTFAWTFAVEGEAYVSVRERPRANGVPVAHGFFETMGIALLEGRDFTAAESRFGADVALIANRTLAQRYLGPNPVGRRIQIGDAEEPWLPVVGIVEDTYLGSRSGGFGLSPVAVPQLYLSWGAAPYAGGQLVVRTHADSPEQQVPHIREVLTELGPTAPLQSVGRLSLEIQESTWAITLFGAVFTVFGSVTLLMSAVGLFGVMAFAVRQRTREMGVRIALGARPTDIFRLVTRTVAGQVAAGLTVGLGLSLLLGRSLQLVLFDVSATDAGVYGAVVLSLLVAAALAALVPAMAATRVDPVTALRIE